MITRRACLIGTAAALLSACLAGVAPADAPSFDHLRQVRVEVTSGVKRHAFRAWVADTPAARARGLMHVRDLPADRAMLFLLDFPQFANFWMRDTVIPLDLMFIAPDGRIANIIENAAPLSIAPLESVAPVVAVLEVAGGTTARLGIRAGDQIRVGSAPTD